MMHRWAIVGLVLCSLVVGFQTVPGEAWGDDSESSWVSKIISVQGRVLAKRKGELDWRPVGLDDTLFAGDQIRVEANSRAGIVLSNDAVLRLDQNTTLVFTEIEQPTTFIFKLLKGAANFFSHQPHSLKIVTPFVNGVVEGTEFHVQVDARQTRIDLFEGRILARNDYGELQLVKGQGAIASAGEAPQARILVHPRGSVQWALYYPPVLTADPGRGPLEFSKSMALFNQGRPAEALDRMAAIAQEDRDARFFTFRAGLLLNVGRVNEARDDIQSALSMDKAHSDALALQAVIAVVQNQKEEALAAAEKAVQSNPESAAAHIALSYAHQAAFNLAQALQDARTAISVSPDNGTAWARLAELQLCTGELDQGIESAKKAAALNPKVAHAHTILGFAYLTRIKTQKAREAFNQAIALDSAAPLPRLGLGLAIIREGDLKQGRAQIEIAAGLDPVNSLIRSYLGKAYFDEKRGPQDEHQLEIAKGLDPSDPTPWFYDAIRKQTLNRPLEALQDMLRSIELNNNRAIYRSRFFLDDDFAARSTALGRLYSDLSFEELALQNAWHSLARDPSNFSAHRLMADLYLNRPRHEIARISELLQSQLMQPLNPTPVQPQLAEANLQILEGSGPSASGFNEYSTLFLRNQTKINVSGVAGSFDTIGDEITLSGLNRNVAYSFGQYHYESDGFRENNDIEHNIYNGFVQAALSSKTSLQLEYRNKETKSGDLRLRVDPLIFLPFERREIERQSWRIGMRQAISPSQNIIASVFYSDFDDRLTDRIELSGVGYEYSRDSTDTASGKAFNGELQYLLRLHKSSLTAGIGYFDQDRRDGRTILETLVLPPASPMSQSSYTSTDFDSRHSNGYTYVNASLFENIEVTCGLAFDSIDGRLVKKDKLSPKVGFIWSPSQAVTFRTAWFQTVKRPLVANQTVEPTHVAGFNQFFDDSDGTESERFGIALDAMLSNRLFSGVETTWRDSDKPIFRTVDGSTRTEKLTEQLHHVYLYWIPSMQSALNLEGWYEHFSRSIYTPEDLYTYRFPISLSYFLKNGISSRLTATFIDQRFVDELINDRNHFWVLDAVLGYRMPNRMGVLSVGVKNLLNTSINYYDINFSTGEPLPPQYWPDRLYFAQVSLSF